MNELPVFNVKRGLTSDKICDNGIKSNRPRYTGVEIASISSTHKSNLVPVRRDNLQELKEIAKMRTG